MLDYDHFFRSSFVFWRENIQLRIEHRKVRGRNPISPILGIRINHLLSRYYHLILQEVNDIFYMYFSQKTSVIILCIYQM